MKILNSIAHLAINATTGAGRLAVKTVGHALALPNRTLETAEVIGEGINAFADAQMHGKRAHDAVDRIGDRLSQKRLQRRQVPEKETVEAEAVEAEAVPA